MLSECEESTKTKTKKVKQKKQRGLESIAEDTTATDNVPHINEAARIAVAATTSDKKLQAVLELYLSGKPSAAVDELGEKSMSQEKAGAFEEEEVDVI